MGSRRALHYVLKVGDRGQTARFYRELLEMKGITIQSSQAVQHARQMKWPLSDPADGLFEVVAPGGYIFYLENKDQPKTDPVQKVALAVSDLQKSLHYWSSLLEMKIYSKDKTNKTALLGYAENQAPVGCYPYAGLFNAYMVNTFASTTFQLDFTFYCYNNLCKLELQEIGGPVDHGTAFGRIAFACPKNKDGHEICFVGDEAFQELSQTDPTADKLLNDAMTADKSEEWFAKHNRQKPSA